MSRSRLLLVCFLPLALAACRREDVPKLDKPGQATNLMRAPGTGGSCLPGEKQVCTNGPPPVCRCEPVPVAVDRK